MATENITIARPYAKAAFEIALEKNALAPWSKFLHVAAFACQDKDVREFLKNPRYSAEQHLEFFLDVCKNASEDQQQFLHVIAEQKRFLVLPQIAVVYEFLKDEQEKVIEVKVTSFKPMSDSQKQSLTAALKKKLSRDIQLDCVIDEALLGGAVITAGDLVIDGSVRGKLSRLQDEMIM